MRPSAILILCGSLVLLHRATSRSFLHSNPSVVGITEPKAQDGVLFDLENGGMKEDEFGSIMGGGVDENLVRADWESIIREFSETHESDNLIRSSHLIGRSDKLDCHGLLSERIQAVCGGSGDDVKALSHENDRISIAISLTLCSISSLNQRGPVECDLWSPSHSGSGASDNLAALNDWNGESIQIDEKVLGKRGSCLQALHRSPQDWGSYNVYLSDATTLCYSLESTRRTNMVNSLYRNITFEKLALLRMMNVHEKRKRDAEENREKKWDEKMEDLQRTTDSLYTDQATMASIFSTTISSGHSLISALFQALEETTRGGISFWEEMREWRSREMDEAAQEMRGLWRAEGKALVEELAAGFSNSLGKFSMATSERVAAFDESTAGIISKLEVYGRDVLDRQREWQDTIDDKWHQLDLLGSSITNQLVVIDDQVTMLPSTLEMSMIMANTLHSLQTSHKNTLQEAAEVAISLHEALVKSVTEASDTVVTLQDIKAELLQDRWRSPSPRGLTSWLLGMVFSPISLVASGSSTLLPILKILGYTLDGILGLLGTVLYIATSLWLVLRTGAWRLLRGAARLAYDEYWRLRDEASSRDGDAESRYQTPQHRCAILPPPSKALAAGAATSSRRFVTGPLPFTRPHHDQYHHNVLAIPRKSSRGMQLDRLSRRAQSEPL